MALQKKPIGLSLYEVQVSRLAKSLIIIAGLVFGFAGAVQLTWPFLISITDNLVCKKLGPESCESRNLRFASEGSPTAVAPKVDRAQDFAPPPPPPPPASGLSDERMAPPPPPPLGVSEAALQQEKLVSPTPQKIEAAEVAAQLERGDFTAFDAWLTQGHTVDEALNNQGMTALMLASSVGNPQAVRTLLNLKPSLVIQDRNGQTALHHAVLAKRADVAASLLEAGASPTIKDRNGMSAQRLAKETKNQAMMKLFYLPSKKEKSTAKTKPEAAKLSTKTKASPTPKSATKTSGKNSSKSSGKNSKAGPRSYPKPNRQ